MPKFNKILKKTIAAEVPEIVLKLVYKEFNALNKMESQQFVILDKKLRKSIRKSIGNSGEQQSFDTSVGYKSSALVVYSAYAEPPSKKLKVVMDILSPTLTPLNTFNPITIDSITFEQFNANLFSSGPSEYSPVPPSKVADKGKGIA
ncbi:hypothetical protein Tco_0553723 [Tanacetum coccineum]